MEDLLRILDDYTSRLILETLVVLRHEVRLVQKVSNRVKVNLLKHNFDNRQFLSPAACEELPDNLIHSPRHYAFVSFIKSTNLRAHRVRLPGPRLPVRKNADVITVEETLNEVLYFFVDVELTLFLVEDHIEVEVLPLLTTSNCRLNLNLLAIRDPELLLESLK